MKLLQELAQLNEAKDPHAWMQAAVNKILDAGNREELMKKGDRELVYIVQQAKNAGALRFTTAAKLRRFIDGWRAKQGVKEAQRFGEPIDGWFVVSKKTGELVSRPFASKDEAQKHLMTKMFANHQDFKVEKHGEVKEATAMFKLQQRSGNGKWEDLSDEVMSGPEAQEFLDSSPETDPGVEERAVCVDPKNKTVLHPKGKVVPKGKDVLSKDASPAVHKRNREFFDKYL